MSSNISDKELVLAVRAGNQEAYGQIVEKYQNKILRYCAYVLTDRESAKDVAQEAFIKAYINLNGFDEKRQFSSWLYRIAHNEAVNWMKKHQHEVVSDFDTNDDGEIDIADPQSKRDFEKLEASMDVEKYLIQMPVIYREPLALYYLEGYKYEEIGDILRLPTGTVSIRIARAKKMFKKIAEKNIHA